MKKMSDEEYNQKQWQIVAKVFDRLMLILITFVITIFTSLMFTKKQISYTIVRRRGIEHPETHVLASMFLHRSQFSCLKAK